MHKKKITILFDAQPLSSGQKSGVGYYGNALIETMAKAHTETDFVGHYFNFLGLKKVSLPSAPNITYRKSLLFPRQLAYLLRRLGLSVPFEFYIKKRGDFILFPAFLGFFSVFKTPFGIFVHDLTHLKYPEYVSAKNRHDLIKLLPRFMARAACVFTISETTKKDISTLYPDIKTPVFAEPVPVIPKIPVSASREELGKSYGINKDYILAVGTLEPRKNFMGIVEAYALLPDSTKKACGLVLAGGTGWNTGESMSRIRELQEGGENIILTGYISDEVKASLYKNARLFVQASFYEGFGMPILEAMSYDLPIVASDIPIFREVAGEAAIYADPLEQRSLSSTIQNLLENQSLRLELIAKGRVQVDKHTWNEVGDSIYERIEQIAQGSI